MLSEGFEPGALERYPSCILLGLFVRSATMSYLIGNAYVAKCMNQSHEGLY